MGWQHVSILEHDRSRARADLAVGLVIESKFQFSSTTEAVPERWSRAVPIGSACFNSRARPKPCPTSRGGSRVWLLDVSILEHDRSRARRARLENHGDGRFVSILEHDRSRARELPARRRSALECFNSRARPKPCPKRRTRTAFCRGSFNSRARPKPCPSAMTLTGDAGTGSFNSRARPKPCPRIVPTGSTTGSRFQFSSTTEAVPESVLLVSKNRHCTFQFSSTTEAVPDPQTAIRTTA